MKSRLIDFNKKKENVTGLTTELKALYISEYYEINDNSLILVANSLYEANYLYQSLSKYNDKTFLFPMDDFLTSEALAVSPELKITRLETLNGYVMILHKLLCVRHFTDNVHPILLTFQEPFGHITS